MSENVDAGLTPVDPWNPADTKQAYANLFDLWGMVQRGQQPKLDGVFGDSVACVAAVILQLEEARALLGEAAQALNQIAGNCRGDAAEIALKALTRLNEGASRG